MADQNSRPTRRITIGLGDLAVQALIELGNATGLNKTDLIDRALRLYALMERVTADGKQLVVFDPVTLQQETIHFI